MLEVLKDLNKHVFRLGAMTRNKQKMNATQRSRWSRPRVGVEGSCTPAAVRVFFMADSVTRVTCGHGRMY